MTKGRFLGFLLFAALMAAVGYGASYWYQYPVRNDGPPDDPTTRSQSDPQTEIEAQGRLEPATGTLAVSALPGDEIVEIKVHVGKDVKEEDVLAVLGSQQIRETEYRLAVAQEKKAKAQLQSELALGRQRIKAAALSERQAKAREKELPPEELRKVTLERRNLAVEQFQKLKKLRDNPATRDAITDAEIEQQRLLINQLDAEILQNENTVDVASTSQKLAVEAAQLDSTMAQLTMDGIVEADPSDVLHQTAELARLAAEATTVKAPCDGKILEIYARKGERVANTPILLMGDLDQMVCIAEVHEANLKDIEVKEVDGRLLPAKKYAVTMKSVALNGGLSGEVLEVGRLIGAPKLRDPNPLARSDLRTAQVRIKLDGTSNDIAKRFVHLQVNVTIHLQ